MDILVYGSDEFGQVIKNLVCNCGHNFVGFIDDYKGGSGILGSYDLVNNMLHPLDRWDIVIAVGYKDLKKRWAIYQKVKENGYRIPSLIHPKAIIDKSAKISDGAIIMAGAIVDYNVEIKEGAVVWNGVVVSHDSVVAENDFLSPNCTICGCSTLGKNCFVGANAVVVDHVKIPDNSFIKSGTVVQYL